MNEQDLLLIERYFRDELNEAERLAFEKRRADDPAFQAEVVLHEKAMAAIRLHGRDLLKKKLRERPPVEQSRPSFPWGWGLVVFILMALLVGWWWSGPTGNSLDSPTIDPSNLPADSTQSTPAIDTTPEKTPPSNFKPPVAERQTDTDKLFTAAFKPYKDESLNPSVRAEGDAPTPYEQFRQLYWEGKYAETLSAFERLSDTVKNSDNTLFVKANALLATDRTAEAAALLEGIRARKRSAYTDQTGWYLALAYLKMGEAAKARELLRQMASDTGSPRRGEAERLLENLR